MHESELPPAWRAAGTAAASDHADTELIGHRGWKGTGFLCGEKGGEKIWMISLSPF